MCTGLGGSYRQHVSHRCMLHNLRLMYMDEGLGRGTTGGAGVAGAYKGMVEIYRERLCRYGYK